MIKVLISCADEDEGWYRRLVQALEAGGFSVFRSDSRKARARSDSQPLPGEGAFCAVVLWSSRSVECRRVLREAAQGKEKGALVSVMIEEVQPPPPFTESLLLDLAEWRADGESVEFELLLAALRRISLGQVAESRLIPRRSAEPYSVQGGDESPQWVSPARLLFTAYHPRILRTKKWSTLLAYVHLPDALLDVHADSRRRLDDTQGEYSGSHESVALDIARGAAITVKAELPGCRLNPDQVSFGWWEDWHRAEFRLQAGEDVAGGNVRGRLAFYVGLVLVADVKLSILVIGDTRQYEEKIDRRRTASPYQSVFVSYSHKDALVVDFVERAYSALGFDYLRDVRVLRAGQDWNKALLDKIDEADIFQLCWSRAARTSSFVEKEWKHALKQRRQEFFRPLFWEKPMPDPPPELSHLHFSFLDLRREGGR